MFSSMRLFLFCVVLLPVCILSTVTNLCATNNDGRKYFTKSKGWHFNDIIYKRTGDSCVISINTECELFVQTDSNHRDDCFVDGTEARCMCIGRMCNLDIRRFLKRFQTTFPNVTHCAIPADAPRLGPAHLPKINCLQTKDNKVGTNGKFWAKHEDIREDISDTVCGLVFSKSCEVKFLGTNAPPNELIGPDRCKEVKGEIRCECVTGDNCNGDIEYWLERAKKESGSDVLKNCTFEDVPFFALPASDPPNSSLSYYGNNTKQFCASSEEPYFNMTAYSPTYTSISPSIGLCYVFIDENACTVRMGPTTRKDERCYKLGHGRYGCLCSGRLCNMNLKFFVGDIIHDLKARKDLWEKCAFDRAPIVKTEKLLTIMCLSSTDEKSILKNRHNDWKAVGETKNVSSDSTCRISFFKDCEVRVQSPRRIRHVAAFETCLLNHRQDEVVCECVNEDFCNARIAKWLKIAEATGASEWKCDWKKNIPKYIDFPPPTTTTTRKPFQPATGGCLCDDENGSKQEEKKETTETTTIDSTAAPRSLLIVLLFLSLII